MARTAVIGIDTNVLLRFVLRDDEEQYAVTRARFARALIDRERILIGPVAFAETVWTLARRRKVPRGEIVAMIDRLLATPPLRAFDEGIVRRALDLYGTERAGFSDCIILAMNEAAGCERTISFDRGALRLDHFVHPTD